MLQVAVASPSPVAASSSAPPPPGSPPVVAPVPAAPGSAPLPPGRCCDSGRPLFTDPISGQSVCTCQYDPQTHLLNYQRLATAGLPLSMYSAPYGEQMAAYFPSLGSADQPPFYATGVSHLTHIIIIFLLLNIYLLYLGIKKMCNRNTSWYVSKLIIIVQVTNCTAWW